MLKGIVTFETFDKNGKLIQRETAVNMVTDAVDKIMAMSPWWDSHVTTHLPLAQNILGGLYLFDSQLTESRSNYHLPGNAKIVGIGGRLTDLDDVKRGTLDGSLTGPITNGYKNVWKFNEGQANGRIASVSLTSKEAGAGMCYNYLSSYDPPRKMQQMNSIQGYGYLTGSDSRYSSPLFYDEANEEFYYGYKNADSFIIYKRKLPLYSFGVNDGGNPGNIDLVYPADTIGTINGYEIDGRYLCNGHDGYMYYLNASNMSNGLYFSDMKRLDLNALKNGNVVFESLGEKQFTMPSSASLSGIYRYTINNGYIYVTGGGSSDVVRRFSVSNPSSYIDYAPETANVDVKSNVETTKRLYSLHNGVVAETLDSSDYNNDFSTILHYPDGKSVKVTNGSMYAEPDDARMFDLDLLRCYAFGSSPWYMTVLQEYLGTIFNLPAAVNKDNTMTMTVTYTLTNVTENS